MALHFFGVQETHFCLLKQTFLLQINLGFKNLHTFSSVSYLVIDKWEHIHNTSFFS
jgi:hypothetical protein